MPKSCHRYPSIKTAAEAFDYARDIIKGRWPEGEAIIASDIYYAYYYSQVVIKGRFLEGEKTILKASGWRQNYLASLSINELVECHEISPDDFLILKLKYNDEELKKYLLYYQKLK